MFEPIPLLAALAASGLTSALLVSAGRWARLGDRWVFSLAVGLGCYLGLAILGVRPRWPNREDQDRFLGIVLPMILAAEAGFRLLRQPSRLGFAARLAAATAVAPAIVYGSSYVVDLDGPGSAAWPPIRRSLIFGSLGLATACNWSVLVWGQSRTRSTVVIPLAQATALLGAGPAVMLSGYASGGLTALPLALALFGAIAAGAAAAVGVGLVGLCSVLMMGAFFGRLGTVEAVVLFIAPLLAGVPEMALRARSSPRFLAVLGFALTALAVLAAIAAAWRRFAADVAGL